MQKNYLSENIAFLVKKSGLSQDVFGEEFDLGKGMISTYVKGKAFPKIDTLINICNHYGLTLDELIRFPLNDKIYNQGKIEKLNMVMEPPEGYGLINLKYVELLEKSNTDKDKIIQAYEKQLFEN